MSNLEARPEDFFHRADQRRDEALHIIEELGLFRCWSAYGRPMLVGAVAYDLALKPDIDMEVYRESPRIEDGFTILSQLALKPGVRKVRFSNELDAQDCGLYWQLQYRNPASPSQEVWKIDMWQLGEIIPDRGRWIWWGLCGKR